MDELDRGVEAAQRAGLRVEGDLRNEKINYKVREHSLAKVPVLLALGKREAEEGTVSIRRLGSQQTRTLPLGEAIAAFVDEATSPDRRRAEAVAETVPTSDTVLDGHHEVAPVP